MLLFSQSQVVGVMDRVGHGVIGHIRRGLGVLAPAVAALSLPVATLVNGRILHACGIARHVKLGAAMHQPIGIAIWS